MTTAVRALVDHAFDEWNLHSIEIHCAPANHRSRAIPERLGEGGIEDMAITTTKTNLDAHRFYERHGFSQGFVVYHGKRPRS